MRTRIDPDAKVGRFVARFAFHDDPLVLEALERAAVAEGTSAAAVVRSALRAWLEANNKPEPRIG